MYVANMDDADNTKAIKSSSKSVPRTIQDINNYADAMLVLGETPKSNPSASDKLLAMIKAVNFIDNGGKVWIANFNDSSNKYIHWLRKEGSVWVLYCVILCLSLTYCPVGFYYKERASAEYFIKKHIDLYNQWIG